MYNSRWTAGLPKDKREDFQLLLESQSIVLDRLVEMCYNKINEVESPTKEDYDSPSWAYKQADRNGVLRTLKEIIQLCTPTKPTKAN